MKINLLVFLKHPETMVMTATETLTRKLIINVAIVGLESCAVNRA